MSRVLAVTNWYPPHHFGGYELVCHDVMTRLAGRGHDVTVLCSDECVPGSIEERPRDEGSVPTVHVQRTLQLYFRDGDLWQPSLRRQLEVERANQTELCAVLDADQPDVVAAWHFGALSLGLLATIHERGIPIVYCVLDDWLTYCTKLDPWAGLWNSTISHRLAAHLGRRACGVPTKLVDLDASGGFLFASELTRQRAREGSPWQFPRSAVAYLGIDHATFPPLDKDPCREWQWRLLYMGRFDERKGVDTILRALPALPEARLSCFGRGGAAERARLEGLAGSLDVADRVTFGSLDRYELRSAYMAADVCVFPSTWPEPFGLVPIEAMACGTPVVATGVGGSGEFLLDGSNCQLFDAGDPHVLAVSIDRFAASAELRHQVIDGGLRTARFFNVEATTDIVEEWLAAAIDGFPGGGPPQRHLFGPAMLDVRRADQPAGRTR